MHFLYILFSEKANRYYVGESDDSRLRTEQHNTKVFKGSFTRIADDSVCKQVIEFDNRIQARKAEFFVKRMKSR